VLSGAASSAAAAPADAASGSSDKKEAEAKKDAVNADLKKIRDRFERVRRACAIRYAALPDDVRLLVKSLAAEYAFALWEFLEKKYQNTEEDNVNTLFGMWTALSQDENEGFDTDKARVDEVRSLLEHAKEKPSDRMYSFTLLGKLRPRFKQAVLALKASGKLSNAAAIDWSYVVQFMNTHEREESRVNGADAESGGAGQALQLRAPPTPRYQPGFQPASGSRDKSPRKSKKEFMKNKECYNCHKFGHFARDCREPKKEPQPQPVKSVKFREPMSDCDEDEVESDAPRESRRRGARESNSQSAAGGGRERTHSLVEVSSNMYESLRREDVEMSYKDVLQAGLRSNFKNGVPFGVKESPRVWRAKVASLFTEKLVDAKKALKPVAPMPVAVPMATSARIQER